MRLAAVLFALLACAAAASAAIVPQRGIAGVRLEMTKAQVRAARGAPASVVHGSNDFGRYVEYRYVKLAVTFQGERTVTNISTTRANERTANGIGVGSTKAQVKAKIRGAHCDRLTCSVGRLLPGRKVTTFFLRRGIVSRVGLGLVID